MALRNAQVAALLGLVCLVAAEPQNYNTRGFNIGSGRQSDFTAFGRTSGLSGAGYTGQGFGRQSGFGFGGQSGFNQRQTGFGFGGQSNTGFGFNNAGRAAGNQYFRGQSGFNGQNYNQNIARTFAAARNFQQDAQQYRGQQFRGQQGFRGQFGQTGFQNY